MRRSLLFVLLAIAIAVGAVAMMMHRRADQQPAAAAPAVAPSPETQPTMNALTPAERAAGWKLLFDGKTTAGWRNYRKTGTPANWEVIDGALDRVRGGGDLITIDPFASFELTADWRISPGGNSGIMYHVTEDYPEPGMSGPECQILDNVGGADPTLAGWCYGLYQPPIDPKTGKPLDTTHPAGEWNTTRLLVDGAHVEHWMNGVKYVDYELWSDDWNRRVAHSKFTAWPKFALARSGYICLQDHGGEVAFRNIKIRVIDTPTK